MKKKDLSAVVRALRQAFGLEQVRIDVVFRHLDDACAEWDRVEAHRYRITVDLPFRSCAGAIVTGLLAHELAHIARDRRRGWWLPISDFFYHRVSWYERYEERQTDREVIRRGYGSALLAFLEYAECEDLRVDDDGLSAEDVKRALARRPRTDQP